MAQSVTNFLHKEWLQIAHSIVKKRGKRLEDLCFAKRTNNGYAFFMAKQIPWDILHEITKEIAALYPQYDFAFIAESCSEMVNTLYEE